VDKFYWRRPVLVTGGLGFLGSNLAIRLAGMGARVTVVDARTPGCGSNPENVGPIASQIDVIERDIAEAAAFRSAIAAAEVIFNLAGEVSHTHSMELPDRDLELNALAHLRFLTECAAAAPGVRVVYAGTRQVYGAPRYSPVDETHPINPVDFNGIHKHAAEQYHDILTRTGRLDGIVLRLSNVYGPRMGVHVPCQGFLPVFFRKLLRGEAVEVYGDGGELRDPVYVEDAVDSFLLAGRVAKPASRVFNIGGPAALPIGQIARTVCAVAGAPAPVRREFPASLRVISIGSYASDNRRAQRELGWLPRSGLEEGVAATMDFFRANWTYYQRLAQSSACPLQSAENVVQAAIPA
jgi:UDP-glucose 4-epimerase